MRQLTISIKNVNEAPTGFTISDNPARIDENLRGAAIATFSNVQDPEPGDAHTFSIEEDNVPFNIVGTELRTDSVNNIDYETKNQYTLTIIVTDQGNLTAQQELIVNIGGVNDENPTDITLSSNTISENSPAGTLIGTFTSIDPDDGGTPTERYIYSSSGSDATNFSIMNTNQLFSRTANFDFETKATYDITITSNDRNGGSFMKDFTISITDSNDPPTDIALSSGVVRRDATIGTVIGKFTATDQDNSDSHTFTFTTTGPNPFEIDDTDSLRTTAALQQKSYSISVTANDGNGGTFDEVFTINALDFVIILSENTIDENQPIGTTIGLLSTSDDATRTFALVPSMTNFAIVGDTLKSNVVFDYEEGNNIQSIEISTTDSTGGDYFQSFVINITNVSDQPPTDITLSNNTVDEDQPIGTTIGTLSTTDLDTGDTHTYTTPNDTFQIVGDTLKTNSVLDFETKSSYSLSITTNDGNERSFDKVFTISVNDLDENANNDPTDITLSSNAVAENSPTGSFIGTLSSTDLDIGDTHTYTLTTPNDTFQIVGDTLKTNSVLDFETQSSYSLSITTTDSSGSTFNKDFTINVTDSNDVPTNINLSNDIVERATSIGTVIGNFTATDPDNGDSHTFTLTSDIFQIVGDTLKTKALLVENAYPISVTADDGNGGTFSRDFTIMALDFVIRLSNKSIPENDTIGTTIGLLSTSDDTNDSGRTFALVPSMTNFAIVGDTLKSNVVFDYEEGNNIQSISITTTNDEGKDYSQTFMINITNVSDQPPTDITLSNNTVDEDQPIGTTIGTLSTTDLDAGDTHTYTLTTPNDTFLIVGDTLKTNSVLDFETKSSYSLSITTNDGNEGSFDKVFTISVNDLDENANNDPTDITLSNDSIDEDSPIGTTIGTLTTTDLDTGDTHTYTLTTPNDTFLIEGNILKTNRTFDFETQSSYSLSITTTDSSGGSFDKMFTITINDVEENTNSDPTDITLSSNTVDENKPVGTEIGRLFTVDPDAGDTHTYTLTTPNDTFLIVGDTLKTNSVLDFETQSSYSLSITTNDGNGGSFDKEFTITVNDVKEDGALSINEVDHLVQVLPVFVKDKCALNIEHAFIGKVVVNMYTLNGTTAKTLVYNKKSRNMSKNIPVTLLPSGVYIVKIQFGNFVALKKIVKH